MAKISPVSSKYIINATIEIEGVVDRPDVIGAIFGQTEGLLGADLELRELQRSGRIGRIEVNVDTRSGKTQGSIIIPSSLDKAETSIVAAALEVIQRIGPCNAKIKVKEIEDVRISKRNFVVERAKALLKNLMDQQMPDSQELADEVAHSVRIMEIQEYGRERLPAGPMIEDSDEIILVDGRADVLNLLKHGFKNAIAMNGTSCPQTIIDLSRKKEVLAFVDGDRGGNLIIKELINVGEIDFVTKAPDGKEVEELTKKELHKALRSKITIEQAKHELASRDTSESIKRPNFRRTAPHSSARPQSTQRRPIHNMSRPAATRPQSRPPVKAAAISLNGEEKTKFKTMLENLIGTKGAYILDNQLHVLGKVPFTELATTLKSLNTGIYAVVFDGSADKTIVDVASRAGVKHVVAMGSAVTGARGINIVTIKNL
ncbi:DNA primase [Candidatus Woesearchaeota archaeon]|nr:DNA primase [Candidatus Woesearchaeota archaeon]